MKKILVLLIILFVYSEALALTYYASPSGATTNCTTMQTQATPASSIQAALNCANQGASADTIVLRGGIYTEYNDSANGFSIYIPSSVSTAANKRLTIQNFSGEIATIRPSGCRWAMFTDQYYGKGFITLDGSQGFTVSDPRQPGATQQYGIVFDGINCTLGSNADNGAGGLVLWLYDGNGTSAQGRGWIVKSVDFMRIPYYCTAYMHNMTIQYSSCRDTRNNGQGTQAWVQGWDMNGPNNIIEYTKLTNVNSSIGGAGAIHGCSHGSVSDCTNSIIRYNFITDSNAPIQAYYFAGTRVYGNLVLRPTNSRSGITITQYGAGQVIIYNNTITSVTGAACMEFFAGANTIRNNIVYNCSGGPFAQNVAGGTFSNNLSTNPLFTNAAGGNYTLQSGSAAINAGTATITGSISIPPCGTPPGCYYETAPDIGALESGAGPVVTVAITIPTSAATFMTATQSMTLGGTASGAGF